MTPRNRFAKRMLGLGAAILFLGALLGGAMAVWTRQPLEIANAAVALGLAILAYGLRRQLR